MTLDGLLATEEVQRLTEARVVFPDRNTHWRRWGPYLSDRQWGTVREDYSRDGTAWEDFSHDQARSRAYRWGEDGIAGISDNHQRLCFAITLWNEQDPILKERLFGLTGNEGNHGEDVKEYYFYLDNTPSHAYMQALYKYPQRAFPYAWLVDENRRRGRGAPEFELVDTGVFAENRYYDVFVEYAKQSPDDILIVISVINRGPLPQRLHLLPTLWFRNTWSWGYPNIVKPSLAVSRDDPQLSVIAAAHPDLGQRWLYCEAAQGLLFTENETNRVRFGWGQNSSPYVKDGINDYVLSFGNRQTVNPSRTGTKAAASYVLDIGPGETRTVRLRLSDAGDLAQPFGPAFDAIVQTRKQEADEFYTKVCPYPMSDDLRRVQRQAFAGMLWSKQFYHYVIKEWLDGDPVGPPPPVERRSGRNHDWIHLYNEDIISMPDAWEYPWFAAWDLAFHTIPLALIDPDFAKRQLYLFVREWYQHPNGQLPAYEWAFGDVNPPVHAWAAWRVYKIEEKLYGRRDTNFLASVFQKLLLYFTWWVNRKDAEGNNIFAGGFLGLDNIGVFDRSNLNIPGGQLEQSDGTSWMGMYCVNMLRIAIELTKTDSTYQDLASKFFQHFLYIADAMNQVGGPDVDLWDENDNFYYDILHLADNSLPPNERSRSLKVRSMVGLIPLFAIEALSLDTLESDPLSDFKKRFDWFCANRKDLIQHNNISLVANRAESDNVLLALVSKERLTQILARVLDEQEFLSPYGIRALSKYHHNNPYILNLYGQTYRVDYEPAESSTGMFGGNSNWRGPIWFPVNLLIIEALQRFHYHLGDDFKVECPTRSGRWLNLWEVSLELSRRLTAIFLRDEQAQRRPVYGGTEIFQNDPHWRDLILFYEYFHGDNGAGIGASHQTGWTGLVAKLIQQQAEYPYVAQEPGYAFGAANVSG
ncbi:MAG: glucosidase [Chloroflexales bacterium]|nr:glucosidase [Chloroflexales bacterium]